MSFAGLPPLSASISPTVLLFVADGCPACDAAKPEFERFKTKNPTILALMLDAFGPYPDHFGVKIKLTPTYVLKLGDQGIVHPGAMNATALEKWIKAYTK